MRPMENHETIFFFILIIYAILGNIILYCTAYSVHNIVMSVESCKSLIQIREKRYNINIDTACRYSVLYLIWAYTENNNNGVHRWYVGWRGEG